MAVNKQSQVSPSGGDKSAQAVARGRRLFFGANVALMTLIAALLVIFINWIAHAQYKRIDVANSGMYGLSDRTKKILNDCPAKEITFTAVYTSTDKEKDREKYLPRVRDLFEEMEAYSPKVKVQYVSDDDQKRELIARIQKKFSGKSRDYQELVDLTKAKWADLTAWIQQTTQQYDRITNDKRWLSGFLTFTKISNELARDLEELQQTQREVDEAIGGVGLPRYEQAKQKIEQFNNKIKGHLEEAQTWFGDLQKSEETLSNPQCAFATQTTAKLADLKTLVAGLREAVGDPKDEAVPDDPKPALQAFSRQAGKLSQWLSQEVTRVDEFVNANKVVSSHYMWAVKINPIMQIELTEILALTQRDLAQLDQQIRRILDTDQPKDVLQNAVRQLRRASVNVTQNLTAWDQSIRQFLQDWQKIDEPSRAVLAAVKKGDAFKKPLDDIKEIDTKLKALPELKMADTANKFEGDNLVVVETPDQVEVVDFDQVWPKADTFGPTAASEDESIERRVFNGDAAISAAILALGHKEPFATVVLTSFEVSPPPQMQQMNQPRTGRIPSNDLNKLKERLEQSNFKVKNWNLATDEKAPDPEADVRLFELAADLAGKLEKGKPADPVREAFKAKGVALGPNAEIAVEQAGTRWRINDPPNAYIVRKEADKLDVYRPVPNIYVFLPPADSPQQNPFQRMPQDQKTFGDAELAKVRKVLGEENARGIFLACFLPPRRSFFGSQPSSYGYDKYLRDDWGIDVKFGERVIRGVPDKQDVNRYGLSITRWNWMRLNSFDEKQPVGRPLRSRRCLFVDVCPVLPASKVPENVKIESILGVPGTTGRSEFWAEGDIERLIAQIRSPSSDGTVLKGPTAVNPPFTVILAAENTKNNSRIIVNGAGLGVVDDYMGERVPRLGREERISFDPPPRENGDLFVNCAYWLADRPDFIAAGPVTAPPIEAISSGGRRFLQFAAVGWAVLVLLGGGVMMLVRRK